MVFAGVAIALICYLAFAALQGEHGLFSMFRVEADEARLQEQLSDAAGGARDAREQDRAPFHRRARPGPSRRAGAQGPRPRASPTRSSSGRSDFRSGGLRSSGFQPALPHAYDPGSSALNQTCKGGSDDGDSAPRREDERFQGRAARLLPRDAADPPLRGEGGPALRHGPDRRLLPPLHRPGSGRRRPRGDDRGGRPAGHDLPRPRAHARLRHGPEGRDGRADRPVGGLLPRQGRLDAHVLQGEALLRRPRHRRGQGADRRGPRLRRQVPGQRQRRLHLLRRRRREPGPGLRDLQHGEPLEAPGDLRDREQPVRHGHVAEARLVDAGALHPRRRLRHRRRGGGRHGRARRQGRRDKGRSSTAARATAPTSSR